MLSLLFNHKLVMNVSEHTAKTKPSALPIHTHDITRIKKQALQSRDRCEEEGCCAVYFKQLLLLHWVSWAMNQVQAVCKPEIRYPQALEQDMNLQVGEDDKVKSFIRKSR